MTYLKTENATVSRTIGDSTVTFEPVYRLGGSWIGIFETEDEKLAEGLLAYPTISEISESEFAALKKKLQMSLLSSQAPSRPTPVASVPSEDAPVAEAESDETPGPIPEIKVAEVKPDSGPIETVPTKVAAPKKTGRRKKTTASE